MPERAAELDQCLLWLPSAEPGDRSDPPEAALARALVELAPPGLNRVLFRESSSSALGGALELALEHWQRRGGQHRRRTSFVHLRDSRNATGLRVGRWHPVAGGDIDELEAVLDLHQEEVAGVIVEPLVEIGAAVRVHPPGYLRRVRQLCDRYGAFLIGDETATGIARTGTMFACEQERVVPDFLCLGEGLTGGDGGEGELGAILTTDRVHEGLEGAGLGLYCGARGAGRSACAAALANVEGIRDRRTLVRLQPKIRLLGELLEPIAAMPEVAEVRGRGFVAGIDLGGHDPDQGLGRRAAGIARERGAAVSAVGDVLVLTPALEIGKQELARLVATVAESIVAAWPAPAGGYVAAA